MNCGTPGFPVLHHLPEFVQLMSTESVMPSNHLILCCSLLLLPSVFPSIRVFSSESASGGQGIGASTSASVLPLDIQGRFPLGLTGLIQWMSAIWSLVPLPFPNPACTSGRCTYCWSLAWRILSITLLACETSTIVWQSEHSFALLFGIGMRTDLFQSCGHCWVFQICWHIECSTFTASSFRIWNSSAGILSPPLALFVGMLPKAHLTSHSRKSGSRWVITPSWLSGSLRTFFVQFFCVFLPSLLLLLGPCHFCPLFSPSLY